MPKAKTRSSTVVPVISAGSNTDTHWLPAPADFDEPQTEHWRELCDLVEQQTGLQVTDATTIETAVRSATEIRDALTFAEAAKRADDFNTWERAMKAANAARRAHRSAMTTLKASPDERSSRIAKQARGQRAGANDDTWKGVLK